jgi:transglutaminase-like putative cysteine protease
MLARDLLIADPITDSILRFHGDTGAPLGSFVSSGSGGLVDPHNPTFGPSGDLFVFSQAAGAPKILRYNGQTGAPAGTFVNTGVGGFQGGTAMAFGPTGDLYVATGGPNVLRYDGATGAFEGVAASGNGIQRAKGVEFGPDGNLYVLDADNAADSGYDRILRFNAVTGAFIDTFVEPGSLEDAAAFAFGPDGHIYVPDFALGQTRSFNGTTGELQQVFTSEGVPANSFAFDLVWGPDGNAYAPAAQRILRFEGETGEFLNTFVEGTGGSITFFPPAGPAADLSVTIDHAPAGAFIGENVAISYTVQNNSASAMPGNEWVDVLYWSADDIFDPFDAEIGRITHTGGLPASASYTKTLTVNATDVVPGDYHVLVFADRRGQVMDGNRANNLNITTATTEILPRAESVDPAHTLAVGRALSSWTTNGLVGNQLTITYTVYNLTSDYVNDVSLSTTLQAGVAFESASVAPIQSNLQLFWNAGRLGPQGTFSVDVHISFPGVIPLQLDSGASASGNVNFATVVADGANPARLRVDVMDSELLAATMDANSDDIVIRAKAAELNQDATEIFNFLTDKIGYEAYAGSLRGARGTLWSGAGNSLDEASLMVALLRASGVEARYVQGPLSDSLSQDLVLSMFPEYIRVLGCLEPDVEVSNPANDTQLLADTRSHFWVQFNEGAGFINADPIFQNANIGDTFTAIAATFAELDDSLRHRAVLRLQRELTSPGASLLTGGLSQDTATVLELEFAAVETTGKSLSIGHLVTSSSFGISIGATTHHYRPYLVVNDRSSDIESRAFFSGTDYQEILTNFPFGSQILTGVFLEITLLSPEVNGVRTSESIAKTIFDRIGYAARQSGSPAALSTITIGSGPAISTLDSISIDIFGSKMSSLPLSVQFANADRLSLELEKSIAKFSEFPTSTVIGEAAEQLQRLTAELSSVIAGRFLVNSDQAADELEVYALAESYLASPRVVAVSHKVLVDSSQDVLTTQYEVDILRNSHRVVAAPVQAQSVASGFQFSRGLLDSALEESAAGLGATSALAIMTQALEQTGSELRVLAAENLSALSSLEIPVEAKARISQAVTTGRLVLVPTRPVELNGQERVAWLEVNLDSGASIAVLDNGAHASLSEQQGPLGSSKLGQTAMQRATTNKANLDKIRNIASEKQNLNKERLERLKDALEESQTVYTKVVSLYDPTINKFVDVIEVIDPLNGVAGVDHRRNQRGPIQRIDPPVGDILYGLPETAPEFSNLGSGVATGIPTDIFRDDLFSVPFQGALLPTVFRLGFKNTTMQADHFAVEVSNVPVGFTADVSVSSMVLQPGEIGEVSICLHPTGSIPAAGTNLQFDVTVTSANNPTVTTTLTEDFAVSAIPAAAMVFDVPRHSTVPGASMPATLTITSVGNVPVTVMFDVDTAPDVALTGLSAVTLAPGATENQTLTFSPLASVPLNSTRTIAITPNFGQPDPTPLVARILIGAPGTAEIAAAAEAAGILGHDELARRLLDLSTSVTELAQALSDSILKNQVLANLEDILSIMNADRLLDDFGGPLVAARDQLTTAMTPPECLAALNSLTDAVDGFSEVVNMLVRSNVDVFLTPNVQVAQPLTPKQFIVKLHNLGTETSSYDLAVSGLPPHVTSQFSDTQVTLARDEFADIALTLTQTTANELLAFDFSVDVSIAGVTPTVIKSAAGSLRTRNNFVSVASVTLDQPFVDPGETVHVSAKLLNAVSRQQDAHVSFKVVDPNGASVFTSTAVPVQLSVQTSLVDVDLGSFSTTGIELGQHKIEVVVTDAQGIPIPGAMGEATLLVGSPVMAELTVAPQTLPPGASTVTNTLEISSNVTVGDPLTVVAQIPLSSFQTGTPNNDVLGGLALNGDRLYVFGAAGVHVVNVADPANPIYVANAGGGAFQTGEVSGGVLYSVNAGPTTNIPSQARGNVDFHYLGVPAGFGAIDNPLRWGGAQIDYQFADDPLIVGDHVFVPTL